MCAMPWSKTSRSAARLALALTVFAAAEAPAQQPPGLADEFDEKSSQEQPVRLPPYPKEENLARIEIGPVTNFQFFVDTESISVGADGVIRYTLVARSAGGAFNVSFEGMRCKTLERKLYAFGRPEGTWSQARKSDWSTIRRLQVNPVHAVLAEDYFCPKRELVKSAAEAVRAVKLGGHPDGRSATR